ncbi:hypothetical protein HYPSUDRAFT_58539 [Hypholoma sublateritium FD-334 SS-4]|uniref:Uncharacterized protein n=1 Tax=Hypholoma sublateritium (strain FD-334 SS-4) TaxID=945553 RepID=A0A0D2N9T2_HYPSF|nr:hypothetical protein HYPSUDRAFT_58539 [Hypholoma sublateritium FD-334 SS-4]
MSTNDDLLTLDAARPLPPLSPNTKPHQWHHLNPTRTVEAARELCREFAGGFDNVVTLRGDRGPSPRPWVAASFSARAVEAARELSVEFAGGFDNVVTLRRDRGWVACSLEAGGRRHVRGWRRHSPRELSKPPANSAEFAGGFDNVVTLRGDRGWVACLLEAVASRRPRFRLLERGRSSFACRFRRRWGRWTSTVAGISSEDGRAPDSVGRRRQAARALRRLSCPSPFSRQHGRSTFVVVPVAVAVRLLVGQSPSRPRRSPLSLWGLSESDLAVAGDRLATSVGGTISTPRELLKPPAVTRRRRHPAQIHTLYVFYWRAGGDLQSVRLPEGALDC